MLTTKFVGIDGKILLACLQLSVDVDEDAVLSGLRTILYPEVAA